MTTAREIEQQILILIESSIEDTRVPDAIAAHGKSVEARTLGGEKLHLERAQDGSLRRFT